MKKIRDLISHKINKINCSLFGHTEIKLIEKYNEWDIEKNYHIDRSDGRVIGFTVPHIERKVFCKFRCRKCGIVGIGMITFNNLHEV